MHLTHPTENTKANPTGFVDDTTTSDDTGSFSFAVFPTSAPYDIKATLDNLGARSDGHQLQGGTHLAVDLRLKSAISLAGSIRSRDGTALPHVVVQAIQNPPDQNSAKHNPSRITSELASVVSDEKGIFVSSTSGPGVGISGSTFRTVNNPAIRN